MTRQTNPRKNIHSQVDLAFDPLEICSGQISISKHWNQVLIIFVLYLTWPNLKRFKLSHNGSEAKLYKISYVNSYISSVKSRVANVKCKVLMQNDKWQMPYHKCQMSYLKCWIQMSNSKVISQMSKVIYVKCKIKKWKCEM